MFFNYLNESINEIAVLHGDIPGAVFKHSLTAADIVPITALTENPEILPILPLYENAIVENILFLCGHGDKGEFIRKSKEAYLHYWNIISKGKRIRKGRW